jgi:hypothetical protein
MDLTENAPGRHSVPTNQDWDLLLVMKALISSRVSCTMIPVLKRITCLEFCCGCACMLQGASMVYIKTMTRTILILIPVILIWLILSMMHLMTWLLIMPVRCLHSYKQKHICQQSQNECTDCIIASSITPLYFIKLDPLNSEFNPHCS